MYLNIINKQIELLNAQSKARALLFTSVFDGIQIQINQMRKEAFEELEGYRIQTLNEIALLQKNFKTEVDKDLVSQGLHESKKEQLLSEQARLKKLLADSETIAEDGNNADDSEGNPSV